MRALPHIKISADVWLDIAVVLLAVVEFPFWSRRRIVSTNAVMVCGGFTNKATTCSDCCSPLINCNIISAFVIACGHIRQSFDFFIVYWAPGSPGACCLPSTRHHSVTDKRSRNIAFHPATQSAQVIRAKPDWFCHASAVPASLPIATLLFVASSQCSAVAVRWIVAFQSERLLPEKIGMVLSTAERIPWLLWRYCTSLAWCTFWVTCWAVNVVCWIKMPYISAARASKVAVSPPFLRILHPLLVLLLWADSNREDPSNKDTP